MKKLISISTAGSLFVVSILERSLFFLCFVASCGVTGSTANCEPAPISACCFENENCRSIEIETDSTNVCILPIDNNAGLGSFCGVIKSPFPMDILPPEKDISDLKPDLNRDAVCNTMEFDQDCSGIMNQSLPFGVHIDIATTILRL